MYDSKCYDLAEAFLADEPVPINGRQNRERLAQLIQDEIESFIADLTRDAAAADEAEHSDE